MNREIWTEEAAKQWAQHLSILRRLQRNWRYLRWWAGGATVAFGLMTCYYTLTKHEVQALVQLAATWWFYRRYLDALRREALFRQCYNHVQRCLVETPERANWHLEEIERVLKELA